jgi:hypothetical protein
MSDRAAVVTRAILDMVRDEFNALRNESLLTEDILAELAAPIEARLRDEFNDEKRQACNDLVTKVFDD